MNAGSNGEQAKHIDRVYSWSTGSNQTHVALIEGYNGSDLITRDASEASDRDPTAMIKGIFITLITRLHPDPPSRSGGCNLTITVHNGPFHRNCRSFRSDGYAQIPYKIGVPSISNAFELEINPIDLFRHLPSRVS